MPEPPHNFPQWQVGSITASGWGRNSRGMALAGARSCPPGKASPPAESLHTTDSPQLVPGSCCQGAPPPADPPPWQRGNKGSYTCRGRPAGAGALTRRPAAFAHPAPLLQLASLSKATPQGWSGAWVKCTYPDCGGGQREASRRRRVLLAALKGLGGLSSAESPGREA